MSRRSYPKPAPFTWLPVTTRRVLPFHPPPETLTRPPPSLLSPARQLGLDVPYTLTTHLFPAAYLRTAAHVPVPQRPPQNASKEERREFCKGTLKELRDLRVTMDPQGVPQVLWNCVNRYVRREGLKKTSTRGVTLFFVHANGFPKELWEPTIRHLFLSSAGAVIDEIWAWESVQHGDACMINHDALSGLADWTDDARDILNFLVHYLPSSSTASSLPTHLRQVSAEESEQRKSNGFQNRTLIAGGSSYGGCTIALAALTHPTMFSSLILLDPIIVEPVNGTKTVLPEEIATMALNTLTRRETWSSKEEALKELSKRQFFDRWDPEVLKIYVECGTTPSRDMSGNPIIRLKMPSIQEAILTSETHTECEVYQSLPELDERVELLWIMPDGNTEWGPPGSRQRRVWLRPNNSSNICIPITEHLMHHQAPQSLALEIRDFLLSRYSPAKANL